MHYNHTRPATNEYSKLMVTIHMLAVILSMLGNPLLYVDVVMVGIETQACQEK
jgi:hypothetical protein